MPERSQNGPSLGSPIGPGNIGATAEQAAEQGDFLRGRGAVGDRRLRGRRWHWRKTWLLELAKARLKTVPLDLKSGKLLANGTNLGLGATGCHCSTCSAPCKRIYALARTIVTLLRIQGASAASRASQVVDLGVPYKLPAAEPRFFACPEMWRRRDPERSMIVASR